MITNNFNQYINTSTTTIIRMLHIFIKHDQFKKQFLKEWTKQILSLLICWGIHYIPEELSVWSEQGLEGEDAGDVSCASSTSLTKN